MSDKNVIHKKMTLEEFLQQSKDHRVISRINHEEDGVGVEIQIVRIDKYIGSEFMKFNFEENPVYLPIEKIYFTTRNELMVSSPPFLYIHNGPHNKGYFCISQSYTITCDTCSNETNYVTTNLEKFYCEECWEAASSDQNMIIVMAGDLRNLQLGQIAKS